MHLSLTTSHLLDDAEAPVNPNQSPADMLVLSFTDSDLCGATQAWHASDHNGLSLRVSSLASLKHPMSVDLYLEQVAQHAKIIVARVVGGAQWWPYGTDELAKLARTHNIALAMVPGCGTPDPRLDEASTLPLPMVRAIDACLAQGGIINAKTVLHTMQQLALQQTAALPQPHKVARGMLYQAVTPPHATHNATLVFYRAHYLAADCAPIDALLQQLSAHNIAARAFMVASLKDEAALAALQHDIHTHAPHVILDATAFAAGDVAHPLASANVPILQCALANSTHEAWAQSSRGLNTTDLAMHVVLPESDGRLFTRAISFKSATARDDDTQFYTTQHQPHDQSIAHVASLAAAWARLSTLNNAQKRLALVLSDYPDRAGRSAFAVGLDAPQSTCAILQLLAQQGYSTANIPPHGTALMETLQAAPPQHYSLQAYMQRFNALLPQQQQQLTAAWGTPQQDPMFDNNGFALPCLRCSNITVALQPDRGSLADKKTGYHDATMPPRHGYLAFYWWLHDVAGIDALIHLGTHGNLEWLPGKATALSPQCWPHVALGAVPVVYPYIVCDPGEAAQAKRRLSAITLSHLTPPLMPVSLTPEVAALEPLIDEYSSSDGLDARRMRLLRDEIIERARLAGLATHNADDNTLMSALEAHLCDIKEQRVGNGLHIFGQAPSADALAQMTTDTGLTSALIYAAQHEQTQLLSALNGGFIMPSPGGSLVRGRGDILPTGRNLVGIDPRTIPTRTAASIGTRAATQFVQRYVQDHGEWPTHVVIDVWGSATLRNGGDELAQALYLMGVVPTWDDASGRVQGFTLLADDALPWPRIDVCLRISGLFRDMFSNLIALFDDAVQAVHSATAHVPRIFGNAPQAYGAGVGAVLAQNTWQTPQQLGEAYLTASQYSYGRHLQGTANRTGLEDCIRRANALLHVQDTRETDVLSGADFADTEGGFAAAAQTLGKTPALYHMDTSQPDRIKTRTLAEEIALTLHARALNPAWIAGQLQHGYAGAAALAQVVDQLSAFAATAPNTVHSAQFEQAFTAYMHNNVVRNFMQQHNAAALQAMQQQFNNAIERGFWQPHGNSARHVLSDV